MDIFLKNVSIDSLLALKLNLECMIHDLEYQISRIDSDYKSCSKYSKDFYLDILKDKKSLLNDLRNLYKQF